MNDAAETHVELREVEVDGRAVRYRVAGSGEPLVLVHGLAGLWRWWSPLLRCPGRPASSQRRRPAASSPARAARSVEGMARPLARRRRPGAGRPRRPLPWRA